MRNTTTTRKPKPRPRVWRISSFDEATETVTHTVSKDTGMRDPLQVRRFAQDLADRHGLTMRCSTGGPSAAFLVRPKVAS